MALDTIKEEKLLAMKNYKKVQFLDYLIVYTLSTLASCILCSYLFWFPSMTHFLYNTLPNLWPLFLSPKFVFIVGNVIVLVLLGQSKFPGSKSSPIAEIYDEYIERSRSLRAHSVLEEKMKERPKINLIDDAKKKVDQKKMKIQVKDREEESIDCIDGGGGCSDISHDHEEKEEDKGGEEDELGMPAEELNRRVEDFIARVNRRRLLEAKLDSY